MTEEIATGLEWKDSDTSITKTNKEDEPEEKYGEDMYPIIKL